jgi:hypothetical protein
MARSSSTTRMFSSSMRSSRPVPQIGVGLGDY